MRQFGVGKMDSLDPSIVHLLDALQEGVFIVDKEHKITMWNKSAERITGFSAAEVVGSRCGDGIFNTIDERCFSRCGKDCPFEATLDKGEEEERSVYFHSRDGRRIPVLVHLSPRKDRSGRITGAYGTFLDTSTDMATLDRITRLQRLALLDPLTRLGNRRYIERELKKRIEEHRRYGWPFGVLFVDIDGFKTINDIHGHDVGDRVLKTLAGHLSKSLRNIDFIGRWGGDEFIAAVVNVSAVELRSIAERIRLLLGQRIDENFDGALSVSISVGATIGLKEDTIATLLKRADRLMYASKKYGKNRVTMDAASSVRLPAHKPDQPAQRAGV